MAADLVPVKIDNTLAFMFETRQLLCPTQHALAIPELQSGYDSVWDGLRKNFSASTAPTSTAPFGTGHDA